MKTIISFFIILFACASQVLAQKTVSYKVCDGKAYYKVVEEGKETMYYRKKLVEGNVPIDFEKVSNRIFNYQYEEVSGEVKNLEGIENIKELIANAEKEKELQKQAEKEAALQEKVMQKEAKEAEKQQKAMQKEIEEAERLLRKTQQERIDIENELDGIGTKNMTTEEKLLYQLLQESKEQRKHLATLKWITVITTAISVGSAIGLFISALIKN